MPAPNDVLDPGAYFWTLPEFVRELRRYRVGVSTDEGRAKFFGIAPAAAPGN